MKKSRNSVFALLVFLLFGLSNANIAEPACSAGTTPEFEGIKELISKVRESGAISSSVKSDLIARYEKSMDMDRSIINGTHPICVDLIAYDKDAADYEAQNSSFSADVTSYTNQCSGTVSEGQYRTCMTWRSNLLAKEGQLINRKSRGRCQLKQHRT
ncbi:MAG: hypothetical protein CVV37_04730 [Nitrospira bacterium HGW-Nitrospira-1]|nr:MAG: hypothetical protein CVV37_04730 [Nitrospira bacterium HGW-Nitrospira-1]